jgi:TPR repeat protein
MNHRSTPLATGLIALCLAAPLAAQSGGDSIADARAAYYQGQYGRSLALFEKLAAVPGGNAAERAESAECAGFMLLHGAPLYGAQVPRDVERARRLLLQAARAGRASAVFTLNMLDASD